MGPVTAQMTTMPTAVKNVTGLPERRAWRGPTGRTSQLRVAAVRRWSRLEGLHAFFLLVLVCEAANGSLLALCSFCHPDTGTTAVLGDKLDAGFFEGGLNFTERIDTRFELPIHNLKALDRFKRHVSGCS